MTGTGEAISSSPPSDDFHQALESSLVIDILGTTIYMLLRDSLKCGANVERRETVI